MIPTLPIFLLLSLEIMWWIAVFFGLRRIKRHRPKKE